ncbi:MAG: HAMP domain-containing protein [Candidatus Colwellbacteria bacterium]|nr:HAMP domain-containing protein [Candidatus Colwellbacteria bacterium]
MRYLFFINLCVFLAVWLGITIYTFLALFNLSLAYSVSLFALFLVLLNILGLPLLYLWYKTRQKTIQLKTALTVSTVILIFYWGPFAPVHSFISLHLNDLQLRWIAFAYIWEVVLVGALAVYAVLRVTRSADRFLKGELSEHDVPEEVHRRLAMIPLRATTAFVSLVVFGYSVGSLQLYYFSLLPIEETLKNFTNGVVGAIISSFIVFFLLERIVDPALRKSGILIQSSPPVKSPKRLSLFTKIYAISGLLALASVGFFGTMAYGRSQVILEEQLKNRLQHELTLLKIQVERTGVFVSGEEQKARFGAKGEIFLLTRPGQDHPFLAPEKPLLSQEVLSRWTDTVSRESVAIDRNSQTKIIATLPIDELNSLVGIGFLTDFDEELGRLLLYSILVFLMIAAIVGLIGTLFARSITLPIKEIQEGSARIGRGNFSQPLIVYTNDELEELSNALNDASAQLKESYAHLEQEVKARTLEIAQTNQKLEEEIRELDKTAKLLVQRDFELQEANNILRELDQAKTQFVSVAAHQLRTPLSVSKWTYEMLLSGDYGSLNKEQREVLERGNLTNEQMIELVSDLLDVARIESGKLEFVFKLIDLFEILTEIKNLYTQKAQEKQIIFDLQIPEKGTTKVKGDATRLGMVVQNLLDNAFKFTPRGGRITLGFESKDDMVEFRVSDTGIGIPKKEIPRLFTKFFRGRNVLAMDTRGTGLGLYIASSIVHNHKGKIWVESEEGKGSTFFFTIPKAN